MFVVAPARAYREALVLALEADDRFRLAGAAPDVATAIAALNDLAEPPRVLLLDQAVPDGVAAVRPLLQTARGMSVIAVAVDEGGNDVVPWAEAGAAGFVARDASLADLLANVAAVTHGETLCSPRQAAVLVDRVAALARERRGPPAALGERLRIAVAGVPGGRDELGVRLLGSVAIRRGGVALPSFPTQRSEALFAFLVVARDRLIHRDVLCGEFWGDRTDAQARKSLRTALWRIRSVVEPERTDRGTLLRVDGDHVGFVAPPRAWVDVWELAECARMSEERAGVFDEPIAQRLGRVAQLYRGDFMEGHYEDWCVQPRERFRTAFLAVLERLLKHHEQRRDWLGAIACARQILRHDPFREHVHCALMACHHAMGDRPSALRQYRQCAHVLRSGLGIEPMDETRALCAKIRGAAPAGA